MGISCGSSDSTAFIVGYDCASAQTTEGEGSEPGLATAAKQDPVRNVLLEHGAAVIEPAEHNKTCL